MIGCVCITINDDCTMDVVEASAKGVKKTNEGSTDPKDWKKTALSTNDIEEAAKKAVSIVKRTIKKNSNIN